MTRKPFRRIFQTNPEKLEEMLRLRKEGKSLPFLGMKYGVDHTSILHLCQKFGVKPEVKVVRKTISYSETEELPKCLVCGKPTKTRFNKYCSRQCGYKWNNKGLIMKVLEPEKVLGPGEERINPGKECYADYIEAAEEREERKRKNKYTPVVVLTGPH